MQSSSKINRRVPIFNANIQEEYIKYNKNNALVHNIISQGKC